jgi:hypothetical protein
MWTAFLPIHGSIERHKKFRGVLFSIMTQTVGRGTGYCLIILILRDKGSLVMNH